jgi:uncharacterized protein
MPTLKARIEALTPTAEFAVVVSIAFGLFTAGSLRHVLYDYGKPAITTGHLRSVFAYEVVALPVLWFFLRQRNWTLARLSVNPLGRDIPVGVGLSVVTYIAYYVSWQLAVLAAPDLMRSVYSMPLVVERLDIAWVTLVALLNPIFEETFLCGYVVNSISTVRSPTVAVNVSIGIRVLYHLYQGPLAVVGVLPVGLVFTWYFARTRRLWPVIVAHAIFDFLGLARYAC